jgi:hypothetical protein
MLCITCGPYLIRKRPLHNARILRPRGKAGQKKYQNERLGLRH